MVYLPLWKKYDFVNWDHYSQLNGKIKNVPKQQPGKENRHQLINYFYFARYHWTILNQDRVPFFSPAVTQQKNSGDPSLGPFAIPWPGAWLVLPASSGGFSRCGMEDISWCTADRIPWFTTWIQLSFRAMSRSEKVKRFKKNTWLPIIPMM